MYGLWGNATLGGKTLQLRALDWDTDGGLQDYPVIAIYHPRTSKLGHPFANIAWAGENILILSFFSNYNYFQYILRLYWNIIWYVISTSWYFGNWCFLS